MGGPLPEAGGKIEACSLHIGRSELGHTFDQTYPEFASGIMCPFRSFLDQVPASCSPKAPNNEDPKNIDEADIPASCSLNDGGPDEVAESSEQPAPGCSGSSLELAPAGDVSDLEAAPAVADPHTGNAADCSGSGLAASSDVSDLATAPSDTALADLLTNAKESWPLLLPSPNFDNFNYNFGNPTSIATLNDFLIKYGESTIHPPLPGGASSSLMQQPPPLHCVPQTQHLTVTSVPPIQPTDVTTTTQLHPDVTQTPLPSNSPQPLNNDLGPLPSDSTPTHVPALVASHPSTVVDVLPPGPGLGKAFVPPVLHPPPAAPMLPAPTHDSEQPQSSMPLSLPTDTTGPPQLHGSDGVAQLPTLPSVVLPEAELPPIDMLPPIATFIEAVAKRKRQPSKCNAEANSIGQEPGGSKKHSALARSTKGAPPKKKKTN